MAHLKVHRFVAYDANSATAIDTHGDRHHSVQHTVQDEPMSEPDQDPHNEARHEVGHHDRVYRILRPDENKVLETYGRFAGSEVDERDGFIHLSLAGQVRDTLRLHFADESVWLVEIDAQALGDALKFEPSRGGALFPHLYGALLGSVVLHDGDPMGRRTSPWRVVPERRRGLVASDGRENIRRLRSAQGLETELYEELVERRRGAVADSE